MDKVKQSVEFTKEAIKIHEVSSIVVPGLFFLYCLNLIYPQIGNFSAKDLSIGELAVLLILAYGAGHLIQGIGNLIEIVLIEPGWGSLKFRKSKKKVDPEMVNVFKNHNKLCRGIATSLAILLLLAWINGTLTLTNFYGFIYSLLIILSSICLFIYMRRFEGRELGLH